MFSACFTGMLGVRRVGKFLDVFKVSPCFLVKMTKEKKDRGVTFCKLGVSCIGAL